MTTQNHFTLQNAQLSSGAKYIKKNPSFLSVFNEAEQTSILQCMDYLFSKVQAPCLDTQELIVLFCKRLKESVGDLAFHLLIRPCSLLVPLASKDFPPWILSSSSILEVENTPDEFIDVMQKLIEMSDDIRSALPPLERYRVNKITLKGLSQELDLLKENIDRKRFPEKEPSEVFREFSQAALPLSQEKSLLPSANTKVFKVWKKNLKRGIEEVD
ncbi:hypothetical protein [Candidatus Rhabdochlamydia porcellionis]|nr:hypothetical protein [Candidatus Rhabdochlamydia porcellionis]